MSTFTFAINAVMPLLLLILLGFFLKKINFLTDEFLKIGKANSNSGPRFISHHYTFSAPSTLAKSICSDDEFVQIGINKDNVKSWMLGNLHRINIYVKSSKATTELIEAILHYAYRPRFEGNISGDVLCY